MALVGHELGSAERTECLSNIDEAMAAPHLSFVSTATLLLEHTAPVDGALAEVTLVSVVRTHKHAATMHEVVLKVALVAIAAAVLVHTVAVLLPRTPLTGVGGAVGRRELALAMWKIRLLLRTEIGRDKP